MSTLLTAALLTLTQALRTFPANSLILFLESVPQLRVSLLIDGRPMLAVLAFPQSQGWGLPSVLTSQQALVSILPHLVAVYFGSYFIGVPP